jgi:hypothetical protein
MSALTLSAGGAEPRWYTPGIRQYLQRVRAFLRRLLLLIHMTAGLPARGRKLVRVRCCNTELLRSLFICKGYVMLLLCEHGQQRVRFIPAIVGDLLLKFLMLVQPLARILRRQLPSDYAPADPVHAGLQSSSRGPDGDCHEDDHNSNTSADTDVSNGAEWVDDDDGDDNDKNDDGDDNDNGDNDNDNNNGNDGNRHDIDYANEPHNSYLFSDDGRVPWPPSQLLQAMRQLSQSMLGYALPLQSWHRMAEAMDHFFLHGIGSRPADAEPSDTDTRSISSTSSIASTRSTRSTHSTRSTRSTLSTLSTNSTASSSSSTTSTCPRLSDNGPGLRASQRWHRLAGLGKRPPPLPPCKADVVSTVEALFAPASAPPARLSTDEHLRAVLMAHTQDAHDDFDSLQLKVLQQLVRRDADVALVLPAAGGKTLLLMLLASVEVLGVTIVILPFRALLDDLARRCQQHDVPYSTWTAGSRDKDCQLVLATAEQALLPAFGAWATRLHTARKLHHIVLDDVHLMLTAPTVRRQLKQLRRLRAVGVLWGVVSATLPPAALLDLA